MLDAGYYPALYTNPNWLTYILDTERIVGHYDVWIARWVSEENIPNYDYDDVYGMWQYTDQGTHDAIESDVCDLNFAFKDYPTIIKKYGFNGYTAAV